ncbi:hypothetical protein JW926_15690 [Candidatus Sumerlaeota bacterium]|nr:hypothetical protein [Candidatus Sumerlaeota bacterium]
MMKKALSSIMLSLFCLSAPGFAQFSPSKETMDYIENFQGSVRSFSKEELSISIINKNPDYAPLSENIKHYVEFLIIVPEANSFSLVSDNISADIYTGNRKSATPPKPSDLTPVSEWVEYKDVGIFRSWKLAQLKILAAKPFSSEEKTSLRLNRMDFKVRFSESKAKETYEIYLPDILANNLFKTLVINPECESLFRLRNAPDSGEFEPYLKFVDRVNDALSSGPVVKLAVYRSGLYGVQGMELENAGISLENLSPRNMVLYHANEQVPLYLQTAKQSLFGSDDRFFFYAPPFENMDYQSYWLMVEKDAQSNPPGRMRFETYKQDQSATKSLSNIFSAENTVSFFKKLHYHHKLPFPLLNGNWYWDEVEREKFKYYKVDIDCVEQKKREFKFTLHLASVDAAKLNYCEVFWNQNKIGSCEWEGMKNYTFQKTLPVSLLKEGENELVLYCPPRAKEKQSSSICFIGFTLNYEMKLANDYGPLLFKIKSPPDFPASNIWFSQPETIPLFLLNVTNPADPGIISVMRMTHQERREFNFIARVNLQPESAFVLGSRNKALSVGNVIPVSSLNLLDREKNKGDYVIVSHPRFLDAVKPLAEFHENRGFTPVVINVDDIYDCFNFGDKHYEALKRFFKRHYYFNDEPRLTHALLVGETSDFIGPPNEMPSDIQEDLVPTYLRGSPILNQIHSDSPYASICGNDPIPDFGLGRLPVNTAEELENIIQKFKNYETNFPPGEWGNTHLFLTDDEPEFAAIADIVIDELPRYAKVFRIFQQNYPYSDLLLLFHRKTSVQARTILLDKINDGVLTLNYFGHGGPNLWSSERIFHITDVSRFVNKDKLFFLTASTCDTSWLDYPEPPVKRSLGELMILYPEAGAIGVYGPTTGATPSDHQLLIQSFYKGIFDKGLRNFSEAIIYSKILFSSKRMNNRLLDQFILLGNPACSLKLLEPKSSVTASPACIDSLKGGKILIKGTTDIQPFFGLARVNIQFPDSRESPVILKTHVFDGEFQLEYEIPPQSPTGRYFVSAFSDNPYVKIQELGKTSFEVIEPSMDMILDIQIPESGLIVENSTVNVKPRIRNLTPLLLENLPIRLKQSAFSKPIVERNISLQPYQDLSFNMSWIAESGAHEMIWEAQLPWDPANRAFQDRKILSVVSSKESFKAVILPEEIQIKPEPLLAGNKPEFIIPVYNVGTQPFYELHLSVLVADTLVGTPKVIKFLKSGQRVEVNFASKGEFPAVTVPFTIKLEALNQDTRELSEIFTTLKSVDVKLPADLIIVPDSIHFESENFRTGETVFINARVKNVGGIPSERFVVQAFRDKPWNAAKILKPFFPMDSQKFDKLDPSEEQKVNLRWDYAQRAETLTVFVVANSNQTAKEQRFDNNVAEATLTINSHTNLKIDRDKASFSRNYVKKGDTMSLSFVVENDSDLKADGFDVSIEQWGINLDPVPCCEPIRVSGLEPHTAVTLSAQWNAQPPLNNFRITANSSHLIQENLRNDNMLEFRFDVMENLRNLTSAGEGDIYSFKDHFLAGIPHELEINPILEIYSTDFMNANGDRLDIDAQFVTFGAPVSTNVSDMDRDNQWLVRNIWLASSPFENAPPISLSFPLPPEISTTLCDLYVYVHTNRDLNGYPASKVRLKIENEKTFKTWDLSTDIRYYTTVRYYLGRYDLLDSFLDVAIDDVEERYWSVVNHFEVVPIYSRYHSPIIEIPKNVAGPSFALTFDSVIPQYSTMDFSIRRGSMNRSGELQWEQWKPIDTANPEPWFKLESRYLQWKAEFYPWMNTKPALKDARIQFK